MVVSRESESNYLDWARTSNFSSDYFNLLAALDRAETPDYQFTKSDLNYVLPLDEGGAIQNPYHYFSRIVNEEGLVYIGTDIHYFSGEKHILVDEGTPEDALSAKELNETLVDEGIYIWKQPKVEASYLSTGNETKVQVESFNCPGVLGDSEDQFNSFLWWQNFSHDGGIGRTDEQRVGCNRRRCRQGTWGFLYSAVFVTNLQGSEYTYGSFLGYAFDNRRRSGLNWIRTFPNVEIDGDIFNGSDDMECSGRSTEVNRNDNSQLIRTTRITQTSQNLTFSGTAEENVSVTTPFLTDVSYNFPNASVFGELIINDGQISHKWTNRGNNPTSDPIGIEFSCQ